MEALPRVIEIMTEELSWSAERAHQELEGAKEFLLSMGLQPEMLTRKSNKKNTLTSFTHELVESGSERIGKALQTLHLSGISSVSSPIKSPFPSNVTLEKSGTSNSQIGVGLEMNAAVFTRAKFTEEEVGTFRRYFSGFDQDGKCLAAPPIPPPPSSMLSFFDYLRFLFSKYLFFLFYHGIQVMDLYHHPI